MDFSFSEEQRMLRDAARSFLASGRGAWTELVDLGWAGGAMTFLDEAVVFEEMGRALYSGPYFASVALCAPALDEPVPATLAWAEPGGPLTLSETGAVRTKAERDGDRWFLTGDKILVPDLDAAEAVLVVARADDGVALFRARAAGTGCETMDESRVLSKLSLQSTPARLLADGERASELLAQMRRRAYAAIALEAVGVASVALEAAVEHARSREQFGRPIGAFQAVSHQIADAYVGTELARSLAYWAAWCVSADDEGAEVGSLAAKARAAEAAVTACECAIQVHGGMGFTWESPLHRYYKRAQWIESFDGYPARQRAEVAAALLDS